jgi:glycosyltransferase involved in cell wall biosynthesis
VTAHAPTVDARCLSVVVPCFNEEATVARAVERVLQQPFVNEVVIVDDASTDGTAAVLRTLTDPRVRVLSHPVNQGKGAALRTGFSKASGPFVAVQDADLEYDPADLAKLLVPLLAGDADVVYGSRFLTADAHRVLYFWHSVGNRLLTLYSNMLTNLNLTDMETCYKVFRRDVLDRITIEEDRFGVEPEVTAKVAALGCRIYEVGISYHGRSYAEGKKIGWRDGVRAMWVISRHNAAARVERRRGRHAAPVDHVDHLEAELADAAPTESLEALDDRTEALDLRAERAVERVN